VHGLLLGSSQVGAEAVAENQHISDML
jgi:hypothetical protein